MAGETEFYGLAFFDFGDHLDDPLNVQLEVNRFTLVDTQLYAMAAIFGDGVVTGWTVTDAGNLSVLISPGVGILNSVAGETAFSGIVTELPPNSTVNIYALTDNSTPEDRSVTFTYSVTTLANAILLATVVTGGAAISTIDNTVRPQVGFKKVVADTIATHRHGGVCPGYSAGDTIEAPKIDLTQEVQGLLPNSRMADLDASKIIGGKVSTAVIPTIDHSTLRNIGTLTHPQLDSVVQSIQKDNLGLLGEVASINLMKLVCRLKYSDSEVDQFFDNELAVIPGISPDSYIDYVNSNAYIDPIHHCISGIPELPFDLSGNDEFLNTTGNFEILSVNWNTDAEFNQAVSVTNLVIQNGVRLAVDTVFDKVIETFDEGTTGGALTGYTPTLTETNSTLSVYDSNNPAQGPLSAKFETTNSRVMSFSKTYPTAQDWTSYDTLVVFVRSSGSTHASVTFGVYDTSGVLLGTFPLLADNEDTTVNNTATNGFAKKQFTISGITRSKVGGIKIFTDQITNVSETFFVDTIYLKTSQFLLPQGNMRLRYATTAPVVFNSIDYTSVLPSGTDLRVRVRTGSSLEELVNATFTSLLSPGETFDLAGSNIEIDITFLSDITKTKTPALTAITLTMLSPATDSGFAINTASQWRQGTFENVSISNDGIVTITNTNIGNIYFVNEGQVSELDPTLVPVVGVAAQNMPIAPAQAQSAISQPTTTTASSTVTAALTRSDTRGLYQPKSAYRLVTGNYLIADTGNDRVIEMKQDGSFVRGYASHNFNYSDQLYALTSSYNPRLGVLFITLTKPMDIQNFSLSDITIHVGLDVALNLNPASDASRSLKGDILPQAVAGATTGILDRTISVLLDSTKQAILNATTEFVTVEIIADRNNISTSHTTGMECFIGDYMYFGAFGIASPVYANLSKDDETDKRIIVANAALTSAGTALSSTTSVIEFTEEVGQFIDGNSTPLGLTYSYSGLLFSDIMLGSLVVYNRTTTAGQVERKMLIAGVQHLSVATTTTSATTTSTGFPTDDNLKMQQFQGIVQLVDMASSLVSFQYTSPDGMFPSDAYIDENDNVVVAESTFTAQAGRIITIDPSGLGDGQVPPIVRLIDGGLFTKIWDIRELNNDHVFVST